MASAARKRKNARDKRKKLRRRRIVLSIFAIIIVLIGFGIFKLTSMFNQMDQVDLDEDDLGLEIIENPDLNAANTLATTNPNLSNENIINIALFGIDTRSGTYENSLSDTILIATVDFEHKKLKLASIMRDTYASIPGKGYNKINSAYAYGGPALAIKAINTNFDMNITDFVTVNFEAMEHLVDAVGGIEITIKEYEVDAFNSSLERLNIIANGNQKGISSAGTYQFNGRQALAYSRIRRAGHGDYERTERQRTVLEKVLNKVLKDRSITKAMKFADTLLPYIQTSLSRSEILSIGTKVFTTGTTELVDTRLPLDEYVKNANINGASVVLPTTLLDNVTYLHNFIYENDDFAPSDRLQEINYFIQSQE